MDKRFFLALLLTAIVIVVPPLFFQNNGGRKPATVADSTNRSVTRPDSVGGAAPSSASPRTVNSTTAPTPQTVAGGASQPSGPLTASAPVETTTVQTRLSRYAFSSRGAVPISVVLDSYPSRRPTSADPKVAALERNRASELLPAQATLVRYQLALGRDTIALDTLPLRATVTPGATGQTVTYSGT